MTGKRKTKYKVYPMLIACRCDAGLTQEQLSKSIGVGSETYKRHERGETPLQFMKCSKFKRY